MEKFSCPTRSTENSVDEWENNLCSYCGSTTPEIFLESVQSSFPVSRTRTNPSEFLAGGFRFNLLHFSPKQVTGFRLLLASDLINWTSPSEKYAEVRYPES